MVDERIAVPMEARSLSGPLGERASISNRVHPIYRVFRDRYIFWRQTYEGGKAYCQKYLQTHRLEGDEDHKKRVDRSYFLNYTGNIVDIWTNAIFRAGVGRQNQTQKGQEFLADVTGKGTKPDSFWKRVSTYSAVQGRCHILIDTPILDLSEVPPIPTGVLDLSMRPYLKLITAEALVDWSVDDLGNYRWVLIKLEQVQDADPLRNRETTQNYLLLEKGRWTIFDDKDKVIRAGLTTLDVVPLVTAHQVDFDENEIGESLIKDIAELNRAIFNWTSLLDEILYQQTFGQLVAAADEGELDKRLMGTNRVFTIPKDSPFPPLYISPDASQAGVFITWIGKAVKELFRLGFARKSGMDEPEQYNTATGKVIDLFDLQQALANKSAALQEAETRTTEIVGKIYGQKERVYEPVYPTRFDLRTLEGEIENYAAMHSLNFGPEFDFENAKKVVMKALPHLGPTEQQKLFNLVKANLEKAVQLPEFTIPKLNQVEKVEPVR